MTEHPYECITPTETGWDYLKTPDRNITRRQDFDREFYFINGAIYLAKSEFIITRKTFIIQGETEIYIMPRERGIDIDSIHDLQIAEALLRHGEN